MQKLLTLSLLLVVQAAAATDWNDYLRRAEAQQLAHSRTWLNLGHYQRLGQSMPPRYQSQADDADFFLAPRGKTDPEAELRATLQGLFAIHASADGNLVVDDHVQCRFPARRKWLIEELDIAPADLPPVNCPAFAEWSDLLQAARVTLIFPSYYLNSPSSMFGHTLLRLDPADESHSDWLSFAVNYGAIVNADDNSLFYALKGLAGGYSGNFKVDHYYKKIKEYNRDENRDIWEYPLNLTAEETESIVLHLWELQNIEFDYFFFDENCSYRVLELLEVGRPSVELTDRFGISAIPVDTVRAVLEGGLGDAREYRPSKASVLQQRFAKIPGDLHAMVLELSQDETVLQQREFVSLDSALQARVIESAYKYLRYQQNRKVRDPVVAARSYALLKALNAVAEDLPQEDILLPGAPDKGHGSRRLSLGASQSEGQTNAEFGFRLSLHSLPERNYGFLPGAQINLGNFEGSIDEDQRLDLRRFDVIDIFSLSSRDRFFQPISWKVLTGWERRQVGKRSALVAHISAGGGYSWSPWRGFHSYTLATARIEQNRFFANGVAPAAGALVGAVRYGGRHNIQLEAEALKFSNGVERWLARYQHNLSLGRSHALYFDALREGSGRRLRDRLQAGYRYYFSP